MSTRMRILPATSLLIALGACSLPAQGVQRDVRDQVQVRARGVEDRRACAEAEEEFRRDRYAARAGWAYQRAPQCARGAAWIASAWSPPPARPEVLGALASASLRVSDRRILDATIAVLGDESMALPARRAALEVVLAMWRPGMRVSDELWNDPDSSSLSIQLDVYQVAGDEPLAEADRLRAVQAIRAAASSNVVELRRVAARIVRFIDR